MLGNLPFLRGASRDDSQKMPNPIAFLALAVFPLVVVALYGRLRADRALVWSLMLGYRPVVFLYHGLWAALYLTGIMILAKSLGALLFIVLLVPLVVLFSTGVQVRIAIVIGSIALAYPILKGADLIPQDQLLAQAAAIDPQRAGSLEFRFDNENTLLERAYQKPVFGWGSFGRNHILDPVNGNILTVTDGRWIIVIGVYGWVGFIAEFGLLFLPLILLGREIAARQGQEISPYIGPLSLLLAINALDMLPNATLTPLTWLLVGALTGYAEKLCAERLKIAKHSTAMKWQSVV